MTKKSGAMRGRGFRPVRFAVLLFAVFCWPGRTQLAVTSPVESLLKEGDRAFAKGDYDAARRSLEKALQIAQQLPADSPTRYDVLKRLTSTSAASGKFADAERFLTQAVAWRESTIGANDPKITDDLLLSVNLNMRTQEFDRALATAQRVQAMHVEALTSESIPVADDLVRIGQIYLAEKKPNEALRSLVTAIGVRTRLVGSLDPGLLPALDELNVAFRAIAGGGSGGLCPGCEGSYQQALAIRETLYGANSNELISTIEGLADVYSSEGMFSAAEPLYLRLLTLWESLVGKDHPMVAVTLDKLVVFYTKEAEPEKARDALVRSVAIRARFFAVGLSHQAADAIAQNRQEQAKALYERALAALGPPDPANEELVAQIREALRKLQGPPPK
jgi:tetratricopeptide (TPR) repeat protein